MNHDSELMQLAHDHNKLTYVIPKPLDRILNHDSELMHADEIDNGDHIMLGACLVLDS